MAFTLSVSILPLATYVYATTYVRKPDIVVLASVSRNLLRLSFLQFCVAVHEAIYATCSIDEFALAGGERV